MAPPKKSVPAPALSDDDAVGLADQAYFAWVTGEPREARDALGDRWEFEPVRDESARLILRRFKAPPPADETGLTPEEQLAGETQVGAAEWGRDDVAEVVLSRVLSLANPA